jgi:hypothetical protein
MPPPAALSPINRKVDLWLRAAALLAEHGDDEIVELGERIQMWADDRVDSDDHTLDAASRLYPGWRQARRIEKRGRLLVHLVGYFPTLTGRRLTAAVAAAIAGINRPTGADGHIHDLLALGKLPGPEHLRKLIAEAERWVIASNAKTQNAGDNARHENSTPQQEPARRRRAARTT